MSKKIFFKKIVDLIVFLSFVLLVFFVFMNFFFASFASKIFINNLTIVVLVLLVIQAIMSYFIQNNSQSKHSRVFDRAMILLVFLTCLVVIVKLYIDLETKLFVVSLVLAFVLLSFLYVKEFHVSKKVQ